jgi:hypothetical protein
MSNEKNFWFCMTDFFKGMIVGFVSFAVIFGVIFVFWLLRKQDRELIEYVEVQQAIESLREDYVHRDPVEFLEVPGVRRAADGASAEFLRKRDEALYRFRDRLVD